MSNDNFAYYLTKLKETPKAIFRPELGTGVVSCPRCHAINIINSTRDVKCSGCGELYRIERKGE